MASATPRLSVIVPVYNEEANLDELCRRVSEALIDGPDYEVILVNDGSTDASGERLDAIAEGNTRFKVVHFRRNYGQTAAMMAGFGHSSSDVIVPMDADPKRRDGPRRSEQHIHPSALHSFEQSTNVETPVLREPEQVSPIVAPACDMIARPRFPASSFPWHRAGPKQAQFSSCHHVEEWLSLDNCVISRMSACLAG